MKVGIDSYCFHRYFGEVYEEQDAPGTSWDMKEDFLGFALDQRVDEVALESAFFPALDDAYVEELRERLDDAGLDRVLGWGHPDGFKDGTDTEALQDLLAHIPRARALGARAMRIVASSRRYEARIENVVAMLEQAVGVAERHDVTLALENHLDFTSDELLRILEAVGSDRLRVNFDTGNALRLHEDPVAAARKLAPLTVATHAKDIVPGDVAGATDRLSLWPSCPVGRGAIDMQAIAQVLLDAGFEGALCVELDRIAPEWAHLPEEELVEQSVAHLRGLVASGAR